MKAYKIEMIIVDTVNEGIDSILATVDCMRYHKADVLAITEADIGEWSEEHPLNLKTTKNYQKREYFDN